MLVKEPLAIDGVGARRRRILERTSLVRKLSPKRVLEINTSILKEWSHLESLVPRIEAEPHDPYASVHMDVRLLPEIFNQGIHKVPIPSLKL